MKSILGDADKTPAGKADNAMIAKMHKGGMSNQEIAKITGLTADKVQQILTEADTTSSESDGK